MNTIKFIYALIFLVASLYYSYLPWFHPDIYLSKIKHKRQKANKDNFFVKLQLPSAYFLNKHTYLDLWLARSISLLFILGSILALLTMVIGLP